MSKKYPAGGYLQKILRVDLTTEEILEETVNIDLLYQYIGGSGLAIRLLYGEVTPSVHPYSPENRIIFATGPLTGTLVPGSGTYTVASKNTLTGLAALAQANGFFGARLKYAGYDALIIQGRADHPVCLHVEDGKAVIEDVSSLKGKDTFYVDKILRRRCGEDRFDRKVSIAAIGPAGENLVRFAAISSDRGHVAATGGLGAIMGAKNLKAIVVHGNHRVPIDPGEISTFLEYIRRWRQEARETPLGKTVHKKGTLGLFMPYHSKGWVPVKNLTSNIIPSTKKFDTDYIRGKLYRMAPRSCHGCTFSHCHTVQIRKGPYKGFVGEEPEYEILAGFGPNWGIDDPAAITMLNNLNDRLGMDGKEASFLISMLMEGYEKRLIGKEELDGIDLKWGNISAIEDILRKISRREGVGNLLAEGVMRVSEELGGEFPGMAVFVKKGNAPHIHDSRTRWGTLFTQAISNTGTQEGVDMTSRPYSELGFSEPTSEPNEYIAKAQALTGPKRQFEECLVFCYFQACSLPTMVGTLNSITGADYSIDDCLNVGRRVINLLRMFNKREGMSKEADSFSPRLGQPPVDGPGKGQSFAPTFEKVRAAYYRAMQWDRNGIPTRKTLKNLNLEFTLSELEK